MSVTTTHRAQSDRSSNFSRVRHWLGRANQLFSRHFPWLAPLCVGLLAVVISAAGSWIPSYWGDEVTSVMSATRSWGSLSRMLAHVDAVHGAYYALLHVWTAVLGSTPFTVRLLSALAIGATAAGLVVLVRQLGGSRGLALIAGVVTAILPRMTYAGEEARGYAIATALVMWLVVVAAATTRGRLRPWLGWAIVGVLLALATAVFLYSLLIVTVLALLLVLSPSGPSQWRVAAVTTGLATLSVSPLIALGYQERKQIAFLAEQAPNDPYALLVRMWFDTVPMAVVGWLCIVIALVVGVVAVARSRGVRTMGPRAILTIIATAWAFLPPAIVLAAQVIFPAFSPRYMTSSAPAVALLIALGLTALRARAWTGLGLAAVILASATAYFPQRLPHAKHDSDWAQVSEIIGARAHAGDAVAFDEEASLSRAPRLAMRGYPAGFAGLSDPSLENPFYDVPNWHDYVVTVPEAVAQGRFTQDTVWFVQYNLDPEGSDRALEALRSAGYRVTQAFPLVTDTVITLERVPDQ